MSELKCETCGNPWSLHNQEDVDECKIKRLEAELVSAEEAIHFAGELFLPGGKYQNALKVGQDIVLDGMKWLEAELAEARKEEVRADNVDPLWKFDGNSIEFATGEDCQKMMRLVKAWKEHDDDLQAQVERLEKKAEEMKTVGNLLGRGASYELQEKQKLQAKVERLEKDLEQSRLKTWEQVSKVQQLTKENARLRNAKRTT